MEANAYRFGNIVLFRNIKMPSGFLEGRIESIDKNHIKGVSIYNDSAELFSGVWEAKGIPLTEEWLVRLGFKASGDKYYLNTGYFEFVYKHELFLDVEGQWLCLNIKHVHSLQNLYFALTNTELTINL